MPCSKSTLQRIRQRCSNAETDALCRVLAVEPVVPCPEVVVARFGSAMGRFLSPGRRPEQNGGWRRSHYPPELRLAPSIDRVRRMVHRQVWRDSTGLVSLPFGKPRPSDPTLPVTTLKTAWNSVRKNAKVTGRFHDNRHTLITELAESGAGDQTIMDIAGHVSKQMLKHYSHIRMEAKADSSRIHCQETDGQSLFRSQTAQAEGSLQKSLHGLENGATRLTSNHSTVQPANSAKAKKTQQQCLELPVNTQHFEGESLQKSLQSCNFEGHRGVVRAGKSKKLIGSSGRTRTYNPSVNSRMLCH